VTQLHSRALGDQPRSEQLAVDVSVAFERASMHVGDGREDVDRHLELAPERERRSQLLAAAGQRERGQVIPGQQRDRVALEETARRRAVG